MQRRRSSALNEELAARWGVRLTNRTGVNTGEVVAGDATARAALATGDVVNVAARLEQAAPPLGILIGESTYRLVRDAVEVEPVEPAGRSRASPSPCPPTASSPCGEGGHDRRRRRPPLVGRERELASLAGELDRAISERTCRLVTVLAAAGLGKSRLTEEFADAASRTAPGLHAAAACRTDAASRSGR